MHGWFQKPERLLNICMGFTLIKHILTLYEYNIHIYLYECNIYIYIFKEDIYDFLGGFNFKSRVCFVFKYICGSAYASKCFVCCLVLYIVTVNK